MRTHPRRCIDFEFTTVNHAVEDVSYSFLSCGIGEGYKRAFVHEYLIASGFPATDEDVDAVILDAELAKIGSHPGCCAPWHANKSPTDYLAMCSVFKRFVSDVRASPDLQRSVVAEGLDAVKDRHPIMKGTPGSSITANERP